MKGAWETKALGQMCQLISGRHIDAKAYNTDSRGIGYLTGPSDFGSLHPIVTKWTEHPIITAKTGDILVTVKGSGVGRINLLDRDEVAISRQLMAVRVNGADSRFILAYLISIFDHFQSVSTGAAIPGLSREQILELRIPFPPLAEQQRIVGILDEAFEGIATAKANAEKNLQNARALFESHLQSVFNQRGEGWVEKTLGEVCILRSGTTLAKELERASGEVPYLKVADMNLAGNLNGVTCSTRYVNRSDVNASNLLPVGTTIFPKRGGAILTNKKRLTACVICADLNIMGVTPKPPLLSEFLFQYFLNLDLREINNGSSIPQINNYSIEPLTIAFPQSADTQHTIVDQLESLREETERLATIYERKLAALDDLKKSLLHQAFSGHF